MTVQLQPPPIREVNTNAPVWVRWFNDIQRILGGTTGAIPWLSIDKAGSNLTDLEVRKHNDLQSMDGGQDGVVGSGLGDEFYHLTAAEYVGTGAGPFVRQQAPTILGQTADYIDFDQTATVAGQTARMTWNAADGTLNLGMGYDGVTQQVGLETFFHAKNQTAGTLLNGRVARAAGTVGNSGQILVDYAIADNTHLSRYVLGILTMDIASGGDGYVTEFGLVRGIETTGAMFGETWVDGDVLYVSPVTAGHLTKVEPTAPNQKIVVAIVVKAHTNGSLFVRPTFGQLLCDCHDVSAAIPVANDGLVWDAVAGVWAPKSALEVIGETTYEITGFRNSTTGFPTGTTLTWDDASRTITLTPTGATFSFWVRGKLYTKGTAQAGNHC